MLQDGTAKDDVRLPEGDLGAQIQADFDEGKDLLVTIVSAMGEEQVREISHGLNRNEALTTMYRPFPTRKPPKDLNLRSWNRRCPRGLDAVSSVWVLCWSHGFIVLRSFVLFVLHLSDSCHTTHSFALYFSLYHDEGMKITNRWREVYDAVRLIVGLCTQSVLVPD